MTSTSIMPAPSPAAAHPEMRRNRTESTPELRQIIRENSIAPEPLQHLDARKEHPVVEMRVEIRDVKRPMLGNLGPEPGTLQNATTVESQRTVVVHPVGIARSSLRLIRSPTSSREFASRRKRPLKSMPPLLGTADGNKTGKHAIVRVIQDVPAPIGITIDNRMIAVPGNNLGNNRLGVVRYRHGIATLINDYDHRNIAPNIRIHVRAVICPMSARAAALSAAVLIFDPPAFGFPFFI